MSRHEGPQLLQAVGRVLKSGRFVLGAEVEAFENEWARYCGAKYAIGVGSGTDAIKISLRSLLPPKSRVLTVANSASATVTAIIEAGMIPVFADVDDAGLLDIEAAAGRFDAVLPVHLYGRLVNIPSLVSRLGRSIPIIEDACQAHGASATSFQPGSLSSAAAYSFYPTKNLGCLGDGGAIVTNDPDVARKCRELRNYGQSDRYHLEAVGHNSRLDEIQAAILRSRLYNLDNWNDHRREMAKVYTKGLSTVKGLQMVYGGNCHLFVVRSPHRDELSEHLKRNGIQTFIHYPIPAHQQTAFCYHQVSLPKTGEWCRSILSLPMSNYVLPSEVRRVVSAIRSFKG